MTLNETIFKSDTSRYVFSLKRFLAIPQFSFFIPLTLKNFLKGNFISSPSNKKKKKQKTKKNPQKTGICRNIWLKVFWVLWFLFVLLSVTV